MNIHLAREYLLSMPNCPMSPHIIPKGEAEKAEEAEEEEEEEDKEEEKEEEEEEE